MTTSSPRSRLRLFLASKGFTMTTGVLFLVGGAAGAPLVLGLLVGLFWRGFRYVTVW